MKLETAERQVITNAKRESEFTISNNAKMFEILSKKIYTYKPPAIVRELSCNAFDSHFEAGRADVPFKVVLPNPMHPYFEIEDFGIGLDDDGVRNVYASYGNSTKTGTNDLIGGMGLGSKTPFSYTDTFSIIARKNGVERRYNAYIGESGAPKVNLLREKETDEPNGVKITVPIQPQHFREFYNSASFILSFFTVRPIVNDEAFEYCFDSDIVDEIEEGGMVVREPSRQIFCPLYRSSSIFVVMGGVCYPIDPSQVQKFMDYRERSFFEEFVASRYGDKKVFLRFNIGELDVTASREGISIEEGKATADILSERFRTKMKDMVKEDQANIDKMDHQMEMIRYCTKKYQRSMGYGISQTVTGFLYYKGRPISEYVNRALKTVKFDCRAMVYKGAYDGAKELRQFLDQETAAMYNKVFILCSHDPESKCIGHVKYGKMLCEKYANDNSGAKSLCLTFKEPLTKNERKFVSKLFDAGANLEFVDLDAYRKADMAANRVSTAGNSTRVSLGKTENTEFDARHYVVNESVMRKRESKRFDYNDLEDPSTTQYCFIDMHTQEDDSDIKIKVDQKTRFLHFAAMRSLMNYIDKKKIVVLVKNKRNARKIEEGGFENIEDIVNGIYNGDLVDAYNRLTIYQWQYMSQINSERKINQILFDANSELLKDDLSNLKKKIKGIQSELEDLGLDGDSLETFHDAKNKYGILDLFENTVDVKAIEIEVTSVSDNMDDMAEEAYDKYPLLKPAMNNRFMTYDCMIECVEYVKMVDFYNKNV